MECKIVMKNINFIYKTTNLINGKIYIGRHSTNNFDDGYLGSGVLINKAIKKYGKQNFKREILEFCYTLESLYKREEYWIKEFNAICLGYNISNKSDGGIVWKGEHPNKGKKFPHSEEWCIKHSENMKGENNPMYMKTHSQESIDKMIKSKEGIKGTYKICEEGCLNISLSKRGDKNPMYGMVGELNPFYDKNHSEETIKRLKQIAQTRPKVQCPWCGKVGTINRMKVYHFDHCLMNPNINLEEEKLIRYRGNKYKIIKCPWCNKEGYSNAMRRWHFDNCKLKK